MDSASLGTTPDQQTRVGHPVGLSPSLVRPDPRPHRPHDDWSYLEAIPRPRRLHHFIERAAATTPNALALVVGDEELTYREFDEIGDRLAGQLHEQGIGPGSTVGILIERSTPFTWRSSAL